jgi:hypothetical protein
MRILILSLPRCGSTSLLYKIAKKENLRPVFEPFDGSGRQLYRDDMDNIVVKTVIIQRTDNEEFTKKFDKVILLSRKNLKEHIESYAYYWYELEKNNYKSHDPYVYIPPPQSVLETSKELLVKWNSELEEISKNINTPITYYEDIYDTNSIDRLRINPEKIKLL